MLTAEQHPWPPGPGEMAERVRAYDWAATPLGPISGWPPDLRTAAAFVLENRFPAALVWGPGLVTIYNDAFRPILGEKPEALGRSFAEIWSEVWDQIGPIAERAFGGESTFIENYELTIQRRGRPEQAWFTFSYSPVRASDGTVVGMIDTVVETTDAVRSRRALAESEQRYRAFTTATTDVVYRMSPDWAQLRQLDGQGFLADTAEADEGWRDRYLLPGDREHVEAAIALALRDRTMFELEHPIVRADGTIGWTLSRAVPIFDEDEKVVEWLGAACDITDRKRAEQELARREQQFETLLNQAPLGVYLVDSNFVIQQVNPIASPVFGDLAGGPVGRDFDEVIHILWDKEYADEVVRIFRRTLETGEPYVTAERAEHRSDRNTIEYYEWRLDRIVLPDGQHGVVCYFRDISAQVHARKEIEKARDSARKSEERLRLIVENAHDYAIFTTDPDGNVVDWREGAEAVFGYSAEEIAGRSFNILFVPEDRANQQPEMERSTAAEQGKASDVRWHLRKDGSRVFLDGVSTALRDPDGRLVGFLKIAQDVTERHAADQRQRLLLAELQHRVRNILALIRSVASRSAETAETVQDYWQHLDGRISTMARTQGLLTREVGAGVDLQNMILDELNAQAAQSELFAVTGPDVALPPKAAEVLGLAVHELATNAVKYGAFSPVGGRVDVRWALLDAEAAPRLSFIWSEFGVPLVGHPNRKGFGTELITERVPYELEGIGSMEFRPGGVVATIEFPLTEAASILQTDVSLARRFS